MTVKCSSWKFSYFTFLKNHHQIWTSMEFICNWKNIVLSLYIEYSSCLLLKIQSLVFILLIIPLTKAVLLYSLFLQTVPLLPSPTVPEALELLVERKLALPLCAFLIHWHISQASQESYNARMWNHTLIDTAMRYLIKSMLTKKRYMILHERPSDLFYHFPVQ